jgi:hypothetical protein
MDDTPLPFDLDKQAVLLGSRDWQLVARAEEVLVTAGAAGLAAAIRGLAHPEPRVRQGCAGFMDHHGTDEVVALLAQLARTDPVAYVRRMAIHSLGCQRCKPAPLRLDFVPLLAERAERDPCKRVRLEAVASLSTQRPDSRAATALRAVLEREVAPDLLRGGVKRVRRGRDAAA